MAISNFESFGLNEQDKHEFNPNETAERLNKYRIAMDKIDLQKLKLQTQIHQLKQKNKK